MEQEAGQKADPRKKAEGRRLNAATLRRRLGEMLAERLPSGWDHQLMPTRGIGDEDAARAQADVLIISPGGRCHFLFAKAPADRWWDGDIRRVEAETLTPTERSLIMRLKRAGHAARPVWRTQDAVRALTNWGCRLRPAPPVARDDGLTKGRCRKIDPARGVLTLDWEEGKRDGH